MLDTRLQRSLSGLEEMFTFLEDHLARHAVDERTAYDVKLVAEELFTNMVRHNVRRHTGSGRDFITLGLEIADDRIDFCLTDYGVEPFDDESVDDVDFELPLEEREPGGLGVFLVKSRVDQINYEYEDGDMHVSVQKIRRS